MRLSVSGNTAEQQLSGLEGSTTYTVTISSILDNQESLPATTTFTTTNAKGQQRTLSVCSEGCSGYIPTMSIYQNLKTSNQNDFYSCGLTQKSELQYIRTTLRRTVFQQALFFPGHEVDGDGLRDLKASDVTPRTALLSWIPPTSPARSYRLTYQAQGYEVKVGWSVRIHSIVTAVKTWL